MQESDCQGDWGESLPDWDDQAVLELHLLIPAEQARALEDLAHSNGQSLGGMIRGILGAHLQGQLVAMQS